MSSQFEIEKYIHAIPDFPEKGVTFRDLSPLFANPKALRICLDRYLERYIDWDIDAVVAIDARGFIVGSILAWELKKPLVMIRKAGKLPGECEQASYAMEYGTRTVEMQKSSLKEGDNVLLFDDLLATGGTVMAAITLIKSLGAQVTEVAALVDLPDLGGSEKLTAAGISTFSLVAYAES